MAITQILFLVLWEVGAMSSSTYFSLLAEFGTGDIPLQDICQKFFGLNIRKAGEKARTQQLPIPVYRGGSQKSLWLVSSVDLSNFIDKKREQAQKDWDRTH